MESERRQKRKQGDGLAAAAHESLLEPVPNPLAAFDAKEEEETNVAFSATTAAADGATSILLSTAVQPPPPQQQDDDDDTKPPAAAAAAAAQPPSPALPNSVFCTGITTKGVTGRLPISLYLLCDNDHLSPHQRLLRKQIELFETVLTEYETAQGRNKPVVLGQVGIRCRHCAGMPTTSRGRGSVFYPSKLEGIYQAAQNTAKLHLCHTCPAIPTTTRQLLLEWRTSKSYAGGGKEYWAKNAQALGVYEDDQGDGLRFYVPM